MLISLLLAGFVLSLALLLAWAVVHFGRKSDQSERKLWWLSRSFVVGGIVFAAYAFWADYSLRGRTLFEDEVEGTVGLVAGDAAPVRTLQFAVEHPGVTHRLLVWPVGAPPPGPSASAEMDILIEGPDGERVLDESPTFESEEQQVSYGPDSRIVEEVTYEWTTFSMEFMPDAVGPHELRITIRTANLTRVHVLITDPLKRDGKRMTGF